LIARAPGRVHEIAVVEQTVGHWPMDIRQGLAAGISAPLTVGRAALRRTFTIKNTGPPMTSPSVCHHPRVGRRGRLQRGHHGSDHVTAGNSTTFTVTLVPSPEGTDSARSSTSRQRCGLETLTSRSRTGHMHNTEAKNDCGKERGTSPEGENRSRGQEPRSNLRA